MSLKLAFYILIGVVFVTTIAFAVVIYRLTFTFEKMALEEKQRRLEQANQQTATVTELHTEQLTPEALIENAAAAKPLVDSKKGRMNLDRRISAYVQSRV